MTGRLHQVWFAKLGFMVLCLVAAQPVSAQTTYYVNGTCGDDTWTGLNPECVEPDGPKATIQAGINAAQDGDTVVVADGVYTGDGNRDVDFGGKLITVRSENGPDNCIVDCEGGENDPHRGFYFHSAETSAAVLDGFTIRNGYMSPYSGGGILCDLSSPTITNCTITDNTSRSYGGGIGCSFNSPTITNCTITGNSASNGGGISSRGGSPNVTNCTIMGNLAESGGGGVYYSSSDTPTITSCTITGNSAGYGGGIYSSRTDATIANCTIRGNLAESAGGGLYCFSSDAATITSCAITGNSGGYGGGIYSSQTDATIANCTIARNTAYRGGGIVNSSFSLSTMTNCTVTGNSANDSGGGLYITTNSSMMTIANCTLWGDTPAEIYIESGDPNDVVVTYSDVEGAWPGDGNIDADPLFAFPDDLRLMPGSPCIDAGDNLAVPNWVKSDLSGNARFVDDPQTPDTGNGEPPIVDIGAYEFQIGPPAPPTRLEGSDGDYIERVSLSWRFSPRADEYRLYRHTKNDPNSSTPISDWQPETTFDDTTAEPGPTYWYWVKASNDAGPSDWSHGENGYRWPELPPAPPTNVDASSGCYDDTVVIVWEPSLGGEEYRVYRHTENDPDGSMPIGEWQSDTSFDDTTADPEPSYWYWVAARNEFGESNLSDGDRGYRDANTICVPTNYSTIQAALDAAQDGVTVLVDDGVYTGDGNRDLEFFAKAITLRSENGPDNCIIDCQATAFFPHRGIYFRSGDSDAVVDGFTIRNGSLLSDNGAGIRCDSSSPTIANCKIIDNETATNDYGGGAGIYCYLSNPTIINCTISNNVTDGYDYGSNGGGIFCEQSSPTIINCTISSNAAIGVEGGGVGGGIYCYQSNPVIDNCTISDNHAGYVGGGGISCKQSSPTISNCTIAGNFGGEIGGGIDCGDNTTITNCTITGNSSWIAGGGVACAGNTMITDCTIRGNSASWYEYGSGGGVYCYDNATVTRCTIAGNWAEGRGGGVTCGGNATMTQCTITGNVALDQGGGVECGTGSPTITICTITRNSAIRGGGVYTNNSTPTIANCTFANNSATRGRTIACDSRQQQRPSDVEIINSILWNGGDEVWNNDNSTITITYSDVQGGWLGGGNINADPLFVRGPLGCYYLSHIDAGQPHQSPCVDSGSDTAKNLGLDTLTTRSDEVTDGGRVDIGFHFPVTGKPFLPGDFDGDGAVDLTDFALFLECVTGPESGPLGPGCQAGDFDCDEDIDFADFGVIQAAVTDE